MRILITAAALLTLVACSSEPTLPPPLPTPAYPNVLPSSALWRMTPGTWNEYAAHPMKGTFDPETGMIVVLSIGSESLGVNRITNLVHHLPTDPTQVGIARVHTTAGTPATIVDPTLNAVLFERTTGLLIGEAANSSVLAIDPPEPLITANPIPGEVYNINSTVTGLDGGVFMFATRYQTISVGVPEMDGFHDVTVTTLVERPGGAATAYVQVFDGEIAEIWYGPVAADNSVDGILVRRIAQGLNP